MPLNHFVSASCEGQLCLVSVPLSVPFSETNVIASRKNYMQCGNRATHKVGEEIPHDEPTDPCPVCGKRWTMMNHETEEDVVFDDGEVRPRREGETCNHPTHHFTGVPRHNLTAYVCCEHFKALFGAAAPCP